MTARVFIAGKTPVAEARRAIRRAHRPKTTRKRLAGWEMNARQRMRDLERLATYRRQHGPALGEPVAWAQVVANLVRVEHNTITADLVNERVQRLGLPALAPVIVAVAVREIGAKAWGQYKLYSAAEAGTLLAVTTIERAMAQIVKLDAIDEPAADRRRRLDRERKAEKRAAEAALAPRKSKTLIAQLLGISRAELYRRLTAGEIDETDLVRLSSSTT